MDDQKAWVIAWEDAVASLIEDLGDRIHVVGARLGAPHSVVTPDCQRLWDLAEEIKARGKRKGP